MPQTSSPTMPLLHCDSDGSVWSLDGRGSLCCMASEPRRIVDRVTPKQTWRVLASPVNHALLLALAPLHEQNVIQVLVGRPSGIRWGQTEYDLHAFSQVLSVKDLQERQQAAPSLGGWRLMTDADLCYSQLYQAVMLADHDRIADAYQRHPAYRALAPIPSLASDIAARLLVEIHDPRYHLDYDAPEKPFRLRCFLGLASPRARVTGQKHLRANLISHVWREESTAALTAPGNFTLRHFYRLLDTGTPRDLATFQTTRFFCDYLRLAWLHCVSAQACQSKVPFSGPFVPAYFFHEDPVAAEAVSAWLSN